MLSKEEKKELLKFGYSSQLKRDFQKMRNYQALYSKKYIGLDKYVTFLTFSNLFANHKQKIFKKIKGQNFKL